LLHVFSEYPYVTNFLVASFHVLFWATTSWSFLPTGDLSACESLLPPVVAEELALELALPEVLPLVPEVLSLGVRSYSHTSRAITNFVCSDVVGVEHPLSEYSLNETVEG
jgi:hypothetical protein